MEKKKYNLDNRIDYGVILPVFLLAIVGMVSLYIALSNDGSVTNIMRPMLNQAMMYGIGAVAVVILMQFNSKLLWRMTPVFYGLGLVMLTLLLRFYDKALYIDTGSKNWFNILGQSFQPAELMKIAYILMMAYVVTQHNATHRNRTLKTDGLLILKMVAVSIPVAVLILLQKDLGTLLVFVAIAGGIFLLSGISWKILTPVILLFCVLAAGTVYLVTTESGRNFLYTVGFKPYQFARIDSWRDPFHDISGNSYQQAQALIAIGSGGMFGKGFVVSDVHVPVQESDMIFSVIGENFGFIGGCFVVLLYFILIYRMIRVCFDTNNEFYAYIATGIIMMLLFHVFENIGANIGLLPLTGIPLPFISQGGSALLGNMIGIGLIMSMRFQKDSYGYEH